MAIFEPLCFCCCCFQCVWSLWFSLSKPIFSSQKCRCSVYHGYRGNFAPFSWLLFVQGFLSICVIISKMLHILWGEGGFSRFSWTKMNSEVISVRIDFPLSRLPKLASAASMYSHKSKTKNEIEIDGNR